VAGLSPRGETKLLETPGLVLRLRQTGESDVLLDLFTRELGRATALAKGGKRSRKRFCGLLLTGQYLELGLAPVKGGSDLWRLETARLGRPFLGLRRDYRRLLAAGPIWELLLRGSAVHDPQPRVLELALLSLERICRCEAPREMISALVVFLTRLLSLTGYGLNLESCLYCGRPYQPGQKVLLSLEGGLTCGCRPPDRGSQEAPAGLVMGLRAAQGLELAALARLGLAGDLLAPALGFLSRFWRRVLVHDLLSLEAAAGLLKGN